MTFCLGINVQEGLVGIADTRVMSGKEQITARKLTVYEQERGALFLMTSGLRSLRDKALTYFEDALVSQEQPFERLYEAVNLFSAQIRRVNQEDKKALVESGLDFDIHALIGGQMSHDRTHKLYLIYPEGNWVDTGMGTPYQIIGSTGYGKPILDRTLTYSDPMRHAFKVGCLAFDSSRISAADVDFPIDVALYRRGSFHMVEHRYEREDLQRISNWWQERLREAVGELPTDWLEQAFSKLQPVEEESSLAAD